MAIKRTPSKMPSKQRKKELRNNAVRLKRKQEARWVKEQLAALKIPETVRAEYNDLKKHLPKKEAVQLAMFLLDRCIIKFMDLPDSKRKMMERLAVDQSNAMKALSEPITKKSALQIFDRMIKAVKISREGNKKPAKDNQKNRRHAVKIIEDYRKQIIDFKGKKVQFVPEIFDTVMHITSELMLKVAGEKNLSLMKAANKQAEMTLMEMKRKGEI